MARNDTEKFRDAGPTWPVGAGAAFSTGHRTYFCQEDTMKFKTEEGADLTEQLGALLGYALLGDDDFRSLLQADPQAAAASMDLVLTDEEIQVIQESVHWDELDMMAETVASWNPDEIAAWVEPTGQLDKPYE
jgi:hypothetical protein